MKKKTVIFLLLLAGAGYWAYGRFMPHAGGSWGQAGGAPQVSVATVVEREIHQWNEFSGRLVAMDQAEIRPQVSGTIQEVHFKDGAMVKKGDPLFTIDPRPYQAALEAARARAVLADADLKRARSLLADKAIAQRDFDQRHSAAEVAKADLATAQLNLDYTHIAAPIDGRASRAEITVGNLVEAGSGAPVLTTLVSSDPIYADFEIDEATFMHYVQSGDTGNGKSSAIPVMMGLSGQSDVPYSGHVESFDNRLNPASGTVRVRAVFDNKNSALVPGLFAHLRLGDATAVKALLITDRAVGTDQDRKFVLVVGADNKAEHREVKLGSLAEGLHVVTDGLKPGEKIIVSGMQRVMMPSQPVKPEVVPMEGKESGTENQESEDKKPDAKKE